MRLFFGLFRSPIRGTSRLVSLSVCVSVCCLSHTARSVKVNPFSLHCLTDSADSALLPSLSRRRRNWNPLRCINLILTFFFSQRCASKGSSAPLLSPLLSWRNQVSSSSHSTFHFSLPPPPPPPPPPPLQPVGMCRLCDSGDIRGGGWRGDFRHRLPTLRLADTCVWCFSFKREKKKRERKEKIKDDPSLL